ncbi:MAG: hypothetical protein QOK38_1289 [Acidobacteriaceae bacterium]|jgi:hypothetical protein|nr:hypothetical protein [Acidobacteriaceae bacterium]
MAVSLLDERLQDRSLVKLIHHSEGPADDFFIPVSL